MGTAWVARVLTLGAVLAVPTTATADTAKDACIAANVSAQSSMKVGQLGRARADLRVCAAAACPAIVRDDCTQRLDEVERLQPTIVFSVRDATGNDVGSVGVAVDGVPLTSALNGAPLAVDPGPHVFTFTIPGRPPVERRLIIAEAEKARREVISLDAPPSATPTPLALAPPPPPSPGLGGVALSGIVTMGVGAAGVVVGAIFGALAISEKSSQTKDCSAPTAAACPDYPAAASAHSSGTTDGSVSTAAFIAGGALLAGGAILVIAGRHRGAEGQVSVAPVAFPHGEGLSLGGMF